METTTERPRLRLVTSSFQPGYVRPGVTASRQAPPSPYPQGEYYRRMETYAHRIRQTNSVTAIIDILDQALIETRALESSGRDGGDHAEIEKQSLRLELEHLRGIVHVDHLTGMLNRGALNDNYLREAARADRAGKPLAIAMLDIDDFKLINDRHGHQTGDDALIHLAQTIRTRLRPSDIVIRFGGEEFLFLLPDASAEQAAQAINRLQGDLDRQPLLHNEHELLLTFSAGIAVRLRTEDRDAVIARADAALYAAKSAGKRQICISNI